MTETWRAIPDFDRYEASDLGQVRIRSDAVDQIGRRRYCGHLVHLCAIRGGYVKVGLRRDGKIYTFLVHRIILLTFVGPANGRQVNHINGIKTDNRLENLEYVTAAKNYEHALTILGHRPPRGRNHWARRLTDEQIFEIQRRALDGETHGALAKEFGCSIASVSRYRNNTNQARRRFA